MSAACVHATPLAPMKTWASKSSAPVTRSSTPTTGANEDLGMAVVSTGYDVPHNDDYDRTIPEIGNATMIYDDVNGFEFEEFVKRVKPDLVGSGVKEKYIFQKMGIPFRQMHS